MLRLAYNRLAASSNIPQAICLQRDRMNLLEEQVRDYTFGYPFTTALEIDIMIV